MVLWEERVKAQRELIEKLARELCQAQNDNPDQLICTNKRLPVNNTVHTVIPLEYVLPNWCLYINQVICLLKHNEIEKFNLTYE